MRPPPSALWLDIIYLFEHAASNVIVVIIVDVFAVLILGLPFRQRSSFAHHIY